MKVIFKDNNFFKGIVVGFVICLIGLVGVYAIKQNINDNKCYAGYSYDETHNICSRRKQVITDEDGKCPYDYGYNEYDNTCVQYDEYKP